MLLECRDVSFSYGKQPVLCRVSFEVPRGELVAVLGANGAGKSTLFRCILGFLRPQGTLLLDGKPISAYRRRTLAEKLAYIPQSAEPIFNYTLLETVLMGTTGAGSALARPQPAQLEASYRALEQLGIAALAHRGIAQVSGGERQLALIARALVQNAELLVMDEPTANLDYGNTQRVLEKIRDLTRTGYTVLLSTHNPEHALRYASRVLALKDGTICAHGKTADTLTSALIESLYGVRVRMAEVETPQGMASVLLAGEE